MNKAASYAAWPTVEILITAPHSEVGPPIVKMQRNVSGSMGQIESDNAALPMPGLGDGLHIESLARRIIHATEQDQSDGVTLPLDHVLHIFIAQAKFSFPRPQLQQ